MSQNLPGTPNTNYDFGYDFDYSLWVPGTTVDLLNVPWNNDYRDVVKFANPAALDTYLNSLSAASIKVTQMSYVKPNEPVRINIPHNRAQKYNYLRAVNPLQPIPGEDVVKNYYYFILDTKYVAPNTTELILQLDVWQTYVYDVVFGNSYIERGHIGIANSNGFNNYGRDYLTVPEGLDIGAQPQVITKRNNWVMTPTPEVEGNSRYPGYDVLIVSTIDLGADPGDVADPNLITSHGTTFQGTSQGASVYVFDFQQFSSFLNVYKDKPWVTQGIVSITMIPRLKRYHPSFVYSEEVSLGKEATTNMPRPRGYKLFTNWRNSEEVVSNIPSRYRYLKKFFTYPYMTIEMTTFTATPVVIKPELWNNPDAYIYERASLVPPTQRVEFIPLFYNSKLSSATDMDDLWPPPLTGYEGLKADDEGDWVDFATQIANFPTMSIINNGAISYLASNQHGIAFQHSSADWTQQRALQAAQTAFGNTTMGMLNQAELTRLGIGADVAQTGIGNRSQEAQAWVTGIGGTLGGAASGAAIGGGAGAAAGAIHGAANGIVNGINTAIQIGASQESLAVRNTLANQSLASNQRATGSIRDSNKSLADWAARGDYANAIAGINAKVQDSQMIQPTTSGQMGGETVNIINGGLQVSLRWKMLDQAHIRIVGEYWLRYGYAIRAFIRIPASLMVMTKFTYWKLSETYISSAGMPEGFKQSIRGIFEKGVTVWANPSEIGNIDIADNTPLPGISY